MCVGKVNQKFDSEGTDQTCWIMMYFYFQFLLDVPDHELYDGALIPKPKKKRRKIQTQSPCLRDRNLIKIHWC